SLAWFTPTRSRIPQGSRLGPGEIIETRGSRGSLGVRCPGKGESSERVASQGRSAYIKRCPPHSDSHDPCLEYSRISTPTTPSPPTIDPVSVTGWRTLTLLSRYQWFVFVVAAIAWMADCMDQQLFNLARVMSLADLTHMPANSPEVINWGTWATAIFLIGWAT